MENEKTKVAGLSVVAAVFLTSIKLIVGLLTGSLGIISEALHSGIDLIAALITWFSVSVSDKPADEKHHFGHGKVENFSALIETFLLLVTCIWIVYEAVSRLTTGNTHIEVNVWSYIIVIASIAIDYTRSRALSRVAKKYNSQALEADALHFSTDIWSSTVVLLGLICAHFGYYFADSVSALFVAMFVVFVSYKLGRKAMDVLLDRAPVGLVDEIATIINSAREVSYFHDLKVRVSGADTFVNLTVHLNPLLSLKEAHDISHRLEELIISKIPRCEVLIHYEPDDESN